ncbi:MAG: nucleotidyltransferase domain-containing protein [Candidatus Hydrothermarchaeaceae archaeon]
MDKESRLLLFFLSNYDRLLNVREISRQTGISRSAASRILNGLHSRGVLARKEVGNQVLYSLNTKNSLTLNMCGLALGLKFGELKTDVPLLTQITAFVDSCAKSLNGELLSIVLFGSSAKGEVRRESDIDILVILRSLKDSEKVDTMAQSINASYTNKISPTTITMRSFAAELKAENLLYVKIVKEGIPVYGAEAYLREVFGFLEGVR